MTVRFGQGSGRMKVVSFTLYVVHWDVVDQWTRYVAGLRECVRVCAHWLPDYTIALMLAAGTYETMVKKSPEWAKILKLVMDTASVVVHPFELVNPSPDFCTHYNIAPLYARYQVLDLYPDAEVLAIRDVDSPPTEADVTAIETWYAHCVESHPMLSYSLPLWGATRIGGGMTFHKPGDHCDTSILKDQARIEDIFKTKNKGSGWGLDEYVVDEITPPPDKWCLVECFHDPDAFVYFTALDFRIPLIDRIDSRRDEASYWELATNPCRARECKGLGEWSCSCDKNGIREIIWARIRSVGGVYTPDKSRVILHEIAPIRSRVQGVYSQVNTYPGVKHIKRTLAEHTKRT